MNNFQKNFNPNGKKETAVPKGRLPRTGDVQPDKAAAAKSVKPPMNTKPDGQPKAL